MPADLLNSQPDHYLLFRQGRL